MTLSNLGKVLYPEAGFTKAQVLDYYLRIAPVLVPHLAGRPMTLKRYPDGVDRAFFYEKQCPSHHPPWVRTAPIFSRENGRAIDYCLVDNRATLLWLANLASIELHPSLARATAITRPTSVVFDLDPGAPAALRECARVALWLREALAALSLATVVKTSGSKGMQVYVPLNTETTYAETKQFARALALLLEKHHPELVVSTMTKALRTGKVFIDWSQNDEHKTTVAVYSLRARPEPSVSAPLTWQEVEQTALPGSPDLVLVAGAVLERVATLGDLFEPMLGLEQALPGAAK